MRYYKAVVIGWWLMLCSISVQAGTASGSATALFDATEDRVFQIRVIDIASGDKSSLGSGFRVGADGQLATNFHVISSFVHDAEKYRLEYLSADGSKGDLELIAVDVIHDLAIVRADALRGDYLQLALSDLPKGERIYSMGNPHDLGMTIVEGNYNGFVEYSRHQQILFSGSLNPGMSGGPALNASGEVIGVNVSKGGEQISFLVPASYLAALLSKAENQSDMPDFKSIIGSEILADQDTFIGEILEADIERKAIGSLSVFGKLHPSLNCWGHSGDEEDDDSQHESIHQHCSAENSVFVSGNLYVGDFSYDVEFLSSSELNRFQFYNLLETRFAHENFNNSYDEDDVGTFSCRDARVNLASGSWQVSTCFRPYLDYEGVYDGSMLMASADHPDKAAVIKVSATGVGYDSAQAVFRLVMESVTWNL